MNDYLAKPIQLPDLAEVLSKWPPCLAREGTESAPVARQDTEAPAVFDEEQFLRRAH